MASNRRKKVRLARGIWVSRFVAASVVIVILSLGYVWQRVQMVDIGYDIRKKEQRLSALKKENQILKMQIAQMQSPKNIETMIHTKKMNLIATQDWQMVVLPKKREYGAG